MIRHGSRVAAYILIICMVLSLMPVCALADEGGWGLTALGEPVEGGQTSGQEQVTWSKGTTASGKLGISGSGSTEIAKLTKQEITRLLDDTNKKLPDPVMDENPSLSSPYKPGKVNSKALDIALDRLNALRKIAGLPAVKLDNTWVEDAQYGAVLLAKSTFEHKPPKPADMEQDFYDRAVAATSSSNIFAGVNLLYAPDGFMDDSDASNVKVLGHRRWQLNPTMSCVGFGYAYNSNTKYRQYIAEKVFTSGTGGNGGVKVDYDYIGWPASGNFPTSLFAGNVAWSVTLNPDKYSKPSISEVKVKLTRESDGQTWSFDNSKKYTAGNTGLYFNVDNGGYGVNNCIVFRPDVESYSGKYKVEITGIKTAKGAATTLTYEVDFFDPSKITLDLTADMFTMTPATATYDGSPKTKTITAEVDGVKLEENKHFTTKYSDNTLAGTATVEITGKWPYRGTAELSFEIDKAPRELKVTAVNDKTHLFVDGLSANLQIQDNASAEKPMYTYQSSNTSAATVDASGKVSPQEVGKATVTVTAPATVNYAEGKGTIDFEVTVLPSQDLAFATPNAVTKTYGDAKFTNKAENKSKDGSPVTYASDNEAVARVDANTGEVTIIGAGTAVITASAARIEERYALTEISYTLTVAPRTISVKSVELAPKTYNGKNDTEVTKVTFEGVVDGETLTVEKDYTVTAVLADTQAGKDRGVTVTFTLLNDNYALDKDTFETKQDIAKAPAFTVSAPDALLLRIVEGYTRTVDLSALAGWPEDLGGEPVYTVVSGDYKGLASAELDGLTLEVVSNGSAADGDTDVVTVTVSGMGNYEDSTVTVEVKHIEQTPVELTGVTVNGKTYDGLPAQHSGELKITDSATGQSVEIPSEDLEWTWTDGEGNALETAPKDAGKWGLVISTAEGIDYVGKLTIEFEIAKAPLKVKPEDISIYVGGTLPEEFKLRYTGFVNGEDVESALSVEGTPEFTLLNGDEELADSNTPGSYTISWSNKDDVTITGKNYEVEKLDGSLTIMEFPIVPPSQGRSEVQLPEEARGGQVSADTSEAKPGDQVTVTSKPDEGYILGAVTVTGPDGNALQVKDNGDGTYSFTMPEGAVRVSASFATPGEVYKDLSDTAWYRNAVAFIVNRGLMNGTGSDTFSPKAETTRGMLVTILYRLEGSPDAGTSDFTDVKAGAWYAGAVAWAEKNGIVTGYGDGTFAPGAAVTRQQAAAILYRYAMWKGYDVTGKTDLTGFADAGKVSGWAREAMSWANAMELIQGTSGTTLTPSGDTTRVQTAAILMRFCESYGK